MTDTKQTTWTYVAELVQTDPEGGPSAGRGHYAGILTGDDPTTVRDRANALIGHPVPADLFSPCCDWQKRETPITFVNLHREDADGNVDEGWTPPRVETRDTHDGYTSEPTHLRIVKEERIQAIHSQEATLEKVFVEATGARLG